MKRFTLVLALLALIIIGLASLPAFAQDTTPEPDTSVVVNVPAPATATNGDIVMSVWTLIGVIIATAGTTGVVSVMGLGVLAKNIRNDPAAIAAVEKLGNSVSEKQASAVVDLSNKFADSINEFRLLFVEALDRIPAASKPQEQPPTITNNVTLPPAEPSAPAKQDW